MVWIVWAVPVCDWISVIPIPTSVSFNHKFAVSLVILFFGSLITISPIVSDWAKHSAAFGSETGLSLWVCG